MRFNEKLIERLGKLAPKKGFSFYDYCSVDKKSSQVMFLVLVNTLL